MGQPGYGPSAYPPSPYGPARTGPSKGWYWAAAGIFVVAVVIAAVLLVGGIRGIVESAPQQFSAPGTASIDAMAGREHTIYLRSGLGGSAFASPEDLACQVTGPDGQVVATQPTGGVTLTIGSDEYLSRLRFTPQLSGPHLVDCAPPQPLPLAVGQTINIGGTAGGIIGGVFVGFLGFLVALVIVIVVAVRRSSARRAAPQPFAR